MWKLFELVFTVGFFLKDINDVDKNYEVASIKRKGPFNIFKNAVNCLFYKNELSQRESTIIL